MTRACAVGAWLAVAAATLLIMLPAADAAKPTLKHQTDAVHALLRAQHPTITAARLRRIGPDVASILLEAARKPDNDRAAARATVLLVHFPSPASALLLRRKLADKAAPVRIRRMAGMALIGGQGVAALGDAQAMLQHSEAHLRDGAANALGGVVHSRATRLLKRRLATESEAFVRETIGRSIQQHRAARTRRQRSTPK